MENNSSINVFDQNKSLIAAISKEVKGRLREGIVGSSLTTFGIGGPLKVLVSVESVTELRAVLALLSQEGQRVRVLGFGSNVLLPDQGCDAWVIRLGPSFRQAEKKGEDEFLVSGSSSLMALARKLSNEGFSGLEFAAGIPASMGGAIFMNAGAHGSEIGERVVSVTTVMADGSLREWKKEELSWRYRSSGLPVGAVVTCARIRLAQGDPATISRRCAENLEHRRATQPLALPSAGSVFKNPSADLPAGKVLEAAGLKGVSVGHAIVSTLHANWIVNPEKRASAHNVRDLIELCRSRVFEHSGIKLEPEVKIWD